MTSRASEVSTARSRRPSDRVCTPPTFDMVMPVSHQLRLETMQNSASPSSYSAGGFSDALGQRLSGFATPLTEDNSDRPTYLSPARLYLAANARFAKPQNQTRKTDSAGDSTGPSKATSPTNALYSTHELRPWDRHSDLPSPLPSPISLAPGAEPIVRLQSNSRGRADSVGDEHRGGTVSPALSTGSKTDAFFATSYKATLPTPPRPLHEKESTVNPGMAGLGKGLPSSITGTSPDRSSSNPQSRSQAFFSTAASKPVLPPSISATGEAVPGRQSHAQLRKSPLRSFTAPHPPPTEPFVSPRPQAVSRLVSGEHALLSSADSTTSLVSMASAPTPPPANVPRLPTPSRNALASSSTSSATIRPPMRRETTESLTSESSPTLHEGDIIGESDQSGRRWKLGRILGEGAFSVVWSGREVASTKGKEKATENVEIGGLVAVKMMDKTMCRENDRTRISFVREVEVLRVSLPCMVPLTRLAHIASVCCTVLGLVFHSLTSLSGS